MSDLNTAIQLIRQGNTVQAQKILETIVRTESNNIPAWLWYVQTWPSQEMRLKVLVACLKFNPGNEQVLQAVRLVKGKISAQSNPSIEQPVNQAVAPQARETFQLSSDKVVENPAESRSVFVQSQPDEAQPAPSKPAFNWDELEQASVPAVPVFVTQLPSESQPVVSEAKAPQQSYLFYKAWFLALTRQDAQVFVDLLDDPEAGVGRAIEWQTYTNLSILSLNAMLVFFQFRIIAAMPEFQELREVAPIFDSFYSAPALIVFLAGFVLVGTLFGVLGLLFNGAIQNFLAGLFGGTGNFSRTVYALSVYLIPISIIATVMSYIPLVNCLAIVVSGYAFVLNVRALQAAHGLNGGRATIIVLIPSLILLMVMCGSFVFLSSWIGDAMPNPNYPPAP